jgi:hypothetical protein
VAQAGPAGCRAHPAHVTWLLVIPPRDATSDAILPGQRALFLMHPQYYGDRLMEGWEKLPVASQDWWRRLWGLPTA